MPSFRAIRVPAADNSGRGRPVHWQQIPALKVMTNSPALKAVPSVAGVVDAHTFRAQPALSIFAEPLRVTILPATDLGLNTGSEDSPGIYNIWRMEL